MGLMIFLFVFFMVAAPIGAFVTLFIILSGVMSATGEEDVTADEALPRAA